MRTAPPSIALILALQSSRLATLSSPPSTSQLINTRQINHGHVTTTASASSYVAVAQLGTPVLFRFPLSRSLILVRRRVRLFKGCISRTTRDSHRGARLQVRPFSPAPPLRNPNPAPPTQVQRSSSPNERHLPHESLHPTRRRPHRQRHPIVRPHRLPPFLADPQPRSFNPTLTPTWVGAQMFKILDSGLSGHLVAPSLTSALSPATRCAPAWFGFLLMKVRTIAAGSVGGGADYWMDVQLSKANHYVSDDRNVATRKNYSVPAELEKAAKLASSA